MARPDPNPDGAETNPREVTGLLLAWKGGDRDALAQLTPLVYAELRRLARRYMVGERAGHPLQATELVHEAYLRLMDVGHLNWQNRAHFFGVSASIMRRILVDAARARHARKRSTSSELRLDEVAVVAPEPSPDLLALDEALDALAQVDRRKSQVVEMRFFSGLTAEETAGVLGVSPETVVRDWRLAKLWLIRELKSEAKPERKDI